MSTEIIKFSASDGIILNGYLNKGEGKNNKVLIEIHGMTSNCFKNRERVIANEVEKINIDTICFNNRGSNIVKYIKNSNGKKVLAGTAYEDIEESYYDILGAVEYALELGYTSVYLQGHSLGATKIVYSYNKMLEENNLILSNIKGIILLSLVDIPDMIKTYSNIETIKYAEEKEEANEDLELMPTGSFIHPISVKTFLKYAKYNENIDFAQYSIEDNKFEVLNKIEVPLFMRWGSENELIKRKAKEQAIFMKEKIRNTKKNIDYIDGANHSYSDKEEILAREIRDFLKDN